MWLSNKKGTEQTKHQTFLATRMAVAFNLRIGSVKKHSEPTFLFLQRIMYLLLYITSVVKKIACKNITLRFEDTGNKYENKSKLYDCFSSYVF